MNSNQEAITIEIDSDLLEKVKNIAEEKGLTAEQYISQIMEQYTRKHRYLSGQT